MRYNEEFYFVIHANDNLMMPEVDENDHEILSTNIETCPAVRLLHTFNTHILTDNLTVLSREGLGGEEETFFCSLKQAREIYELYSSLKLTKVVPWFAFRLLTSLSSQTAFQ